MRRMFLSDVHLSTRHPERMDRFLEVLTREGPRLDELYILGDLFDYWIGPKHLDRPDYAPALSALRELTLRRGVRVWFLAGNRDFYLTGFATATGVRVAPAATEHRLQVGGKRVYLCHGDYLEGRTDRGFRIQEFIRSPKFEQFFIRLPGWLAKAMAEFYRWVSGFKSPHPRHGRPEYHKLSDEALAEKFADGADVIVAGHTHEARPHGRRVDGREHVLYALGDWSEGPSYLVEDDGRWQLYDHGRPVAEE